MNVKILDFQNRLSRMSVRRSPRLSSDQPLFKGIEAYLDFKNLRTKEVLGDGNCLFRSFAMIIDGCEDNHDEFRQLSCDMIEKYYVPALLDIMSKRKVDEYILHMRQDGVWGGELEIMAISRYFHRPVVVISEGIHITINPTDSTEFPIVLEHKYQHYSPCFTG